MRIYFTFLKAGFHLNRSEIWNSFQRKLLRLKWVGNTNRQLTLPLPPPPPPSAKKEIELQVGRGLFGVHLQSSSNFNFPNPSNLQHFTYPQFNLPKYLFHKMPKIHLKICTEPQNVGYFLNRLIWRCLKRERDIGRKVMLNDVKTAFR